MAIASVGTLGTRVSGGTPAANIVLTTSAALEAGNVGILTIAFDNLNTTDGDHSEVSGVVDSAGNTWEKLGEYTNGEGAAADGVTVSLWMTRASSELALGGTVTASFTSTLTDTCASLWEFTVGAALTQSASAVSNATDASNGFGSAAFSGLASKERLYFRALAKEANTITNITPSTSFTTITHARSRNNALAVAVRGEFRINTSTGETSDPALAVSGDTAGVFVALEESAGGIAIPIAAYHYNYHLKH